MSSAANLKSFNGGLGWYEVKVSKVIYGLGLYYG